MVIRFIKLQHKKSNKLLKEIQKNAIYIGRTLMQKKYVFTAFRWNEF